MTKHNDDKEPGTDVDPHVKVSKFNQLLIKLIGGLLIFVAGGVGFICNQVWSMSRDVAEIKAKQEVATHDMVATQADLREHDIRIRALEVRTASIRNP